MKYKDMKAAIETMIEDSHEDFVKAMISFEKNVNDMNTLDKIYNAYMENDGMNLINDQFDDIIEEMQEDLTLNNSNEKEKPNKEDVELNEYTGNLVEDVKIVEEKSHTGNFNFKAANFSIAYNDKNGNKKFQNITAYGKVAEDIKNLKKGDFVKLKGEEKTSYGKDGKKYVNIKANEVKLLKAKEQMKDAKESTMGMIAKLKAETHRNEKMKAPESKKSVAR